MALMAAPGFKILQAKKPGQVGMVFQCDACHSPFFLKFLVRRYQQDRIIFHSAAHEIERPAEKFNFNYLPEQVAFTFREALGCYRYGLLQAFAAMSRLTADAVIDDLGDRGKLTMFNQLEEIREIADLDDSVFTTVRQILLGAADNKSPPCPMWLIVTYFFHTTGELCLSPVGLSSITKLSPKRLVGQMMGIWFMAAALGNLLAGLVAGLIESLPLPQLFGTVGLIVAGAGVVMLLVNGPIRRLTGDVR